MFEDGARIDDILNFFKKPTLDKGKKKDTQHISDPVIRYESQKSIGDYNVKFDFARNSGGLL